MGKTIEQVAQLAQVPSVQVAGHRIGRLVGKSTRGLLVDYPENPHGPLLARTTSAVAREVADANVDAGREVLLVFEAERSDRPIVIGLLADAAQVEALALEAPASPQLQVSADGAQVAIEARDELELRCGEASITLRRNGRVVIRGAYVETRARGVNRIKGGTVQIN